ncbi:transposase family protein [Halomonas campisalis]|uniref:Transposase family protein n=1 Tax=Billgrantia campisalis TaxID=74661 RepID=A0ABS9PBY5_9GAMM|nr:transposase [Halomonas campisalis]MCG6659300.1 transposase family protein [Halomonas campisalis]MDR5864299.1 transposase [Halomonas campisalis]
MTTFSADELRHFDRVAQELREAPRGQKGQIVARAAQFLSCSKDRIYRGLKASGWDAQRQRRRDRGASQVSREEATVVANIMRQSTRDTGKRLLSGEDALEMARANPASGVTSQASVDTFFRKMREYGVHPDQVSRATPYTQMRSQYPNHVHQFDVSVCVLYYLDKGGLAVMDEKRFYKNKPQNAAKVAKQRVLRYLITDHYSGTFYVEYFQAAGEDQETLFEFLMRAWAKRDHPHDPFHGVPKMMVWDAGSANQSHLIRNLLDQLQVTHWAHTPGQPRSKGQVERTHDLVERSFEGRLSLMTVESLEALNTAAHKWMRRFSATKVHTRTRSTRYGLWQTIRPEQLRLCPPRELCEQLLRTKPEPRKVRGDLTISFAIKGFDPATYSVEDLPGVRVGENVTVTVNPYRAPNVFVALEEDGEQIECLPLERDAAGFYLDSPIFGESYASKPDTDVDTNRKAMDKAAYGVETQQEVDKARGKRKTPFNGEIDPISYLAAETLPAFMTRRGTPLDVAKAAAPTLAPLSHIEALKRLRAWLGRGLTPDESDLVKERHPEGVPEDQLDDLAAWLADQPKTPKAVALAR